MDIRASSGSRRRGAAPAVVGRGAIGFMTEMDNMRKPTREAIAGATGRTVPDLIQPHLTVLFVGINPGLYTAAIGHHFGRPGNRFWKALYTAGFTPRLFSPYESDQLL